MFPSVFTRVMCSRLCYGLPSVVVRTDGMCCCLKCDITLSSHMKTIITRGQLYRRQILYLFWGTTEGLLFGFTSFVFIFTKVNTFFFDGAEGSGKDVFPSLAAKKKKKKRRKKKKKKKVCACGLKVEKSSLFSKAHKDAVMHLFIDITNTKLFIFLFRLHSIIIIFRYCLNKFMARSGHK